MITKYYPVDKIDFKNVAERYNSIKAIWDKNDKWHFKTFEKIQEFISKACLDIGQIDNFKVLNAGSGGFSYGLNDELVTHIDIAEKKISHHANFIVSNIESIPIGANTFDSIICVGSVLNYCDPLKVIQELHRVLKPKGSLILEFENSRNFEYLGSLHFNKSATLVDTYYNGAKERIWLFSEAYIKEILISYNFRIIDKFHFHILTTLFYRLFQNERLGLWFSPMDKICNSVPYLNRISGNVIMSLEKL